MTEVNIDLRYLTNPDLWPLFPRLPIKRWRDSKMECGVVICPTLEGPTPEPIVIHLGSVYATDLSEAPTIEYATAQATIDDGWVVD